MTITCADCGSTQTIPVLPPRGLADCYRCGRQLDRRKFARFDVSFTMAFVTLILIPPAMFLPFMSSTIRNLVFEQSRLVSSVGVIYQQVWFPFAFGFLFFAFLFPAIRSALLLLVLGSIRWGRRLRERGRFFRWCEELRIWSMTEVVVVAGVVSYFRAEAPAEVDIRTGAWCYLALAITSWISDAALDRRGTWNAVLPDRSDAVAGPVASCDVCELTAPSRSSGDPCPRCGTILDRPLHRVFVPVLTLVAATLPLIPASYLYSVMVNEQILKFEEYTVVGTIQMLADKGLWQFVLVVLLAGIVIPLVEILALVWLLLRIYKPARHGLVLRTRTYRILRRLVRWPMVIPFIAAISAPIVDFTGVDDIAAGPAATPFFLMIALTMLAVRIFEPRLMWTMAGETT